MKHASDKETMHIGWIPGADPDAAGVTVDELASVVRCLIQDTEADHSHDRAGDGCPPRKPVLHRRETQNGQFQHGDGDENVARTHAPFLVLDNSRSCTRHPLDRSVRLIPGDYGHHSGQRARHDERRRGRAGEREPACERHQSKQHAGNQQRDDEVDNLRVESGNRWHGNRPPSGSNYDRTSRGDGNLVASAGPTLNPSMHMF